MADPHERRDLQGEARRRYVGDLFARIAPRYDLMNTLMTGGMHHRWRRVAVEAATGGTEGVALDLATGTGDLALGVAGADGIDRVVGLDLLPEMVTRARDKVRARDLDGIAWFTVGDGLHLPFPDDTFACATTGWGLRNMPDLRGSLQEMVRVVRPGGKVVSLESMPARGGPLGLPPPPLPTLSGAVDGSAGRGRDRAAYTYLPRSVDRFLTAEA